MKIKNREALIRKLGKYLHGSWMEWAKEIADTEVISADRFARWDKIFKTEYEDISDHKKKPERDRAEDIMKIIGEHLYEA